jgi:uncharacterized protein (DUF1330 family)
MKAYVIANIRVHDPERMKAYLQLATPVVTSFGGRYLARGGALQNLEGDPEYFRTVILEFPDVASVHNWWNSPDYREAKALREAAATTEMIVVEGVP